MQQADRDRSKADEPMIPAWNGEAFVPTKQSEVVNIPLHRETRRVPLSPSGGRPITPGIASFFARDGEQPVGLLSIEESTTFAGALTAHLTLQDGRKKQVVLFDRGDAEHPYFGALPQQDRAQLRALYTAG